MSPTMHVALAPALITMLRLKKEDEGIRIDHLFALYPERLQAGLELYLSFQLERPKHFEAYTTEHNDELTELGAYVTLNEETRANLGSAMSVVLSKLAEQAELQARYLSVVSSYSKSPMHSRLLLMLVLICTYLPDLEQDDGFSSRSGMSELLCRSAAHLNALMSMAVQHAKLTPAR